MRLAVVPNAFNAALAAALRCEDPSVDVRVWPDVGDGRDIPYVACGAPPRDLFKRLPDLEVLFSFAAGVDELDFGAIPDQVIVARMVDDTLTGGMIEYATAAVMTIHRDFVAYRDQQSRHEWKRYPQQRAADRRIGILGLGVLGSAIGKHFAAAGFPVAGWSRTKKHIDGIECHCGAHGLERILTRTDILLSILPTTPETVNLIDRGVLSLLPAGSSLINMGRGAHLVEADLLEALDRGHINAAVLDVFQIEPLPIGSPLWDHPRVVITPHIASGVKADSAARTIVERMRRHAAGMGVEHMVDRARGY